MINVNHSHNEPRKLKGVELTASYSQQELDAYNRGLQRGRHPDRNNDQSSGGRFLKKPYDRGYREGKRERESLLRQERPIHEWPSRTKEEQVYKRRAEDEEDPVMNAARMLQREERQVRRRVRVSAPQRRERRNQRAKARRTEAREFRRTHHISE